MKYIIFLFCLISPSLLFAYDYDVTTQHVLYPISWSLDYQNAEYYKKQICLDVSLLNAVGFYKDIRARALEFAYAPRLQKDDRVDHRFKFLLVSFDGLFYDNLLYEMDSTYRYSVKEYLFSQWGFKVLEYTDLGDLREITPFQLSRQLILEDRNRRSSIPKVQFQFLAQNVHSFYAIPGLTLGVSNTRIDKEIRERYLHTTKGAFWDVPFGANLKLGYDWTYVKDGASKTIKDEEPYEVYLTNSLVLSADYKIYPFNGMSKLAYGVNANIVTNIMEPILTFNAGYSKNKLGLSKNSYNYDSFSIGLTYYNSFIRS